MKSSILILLTLVLGALLFTSACAHTTSAATEPFCWIYGKQIAEPEVMYFPSGTYDAIAISIEATNGSTPFIHSLPSLQIALVKRGGTVTGPFLVGNYYNFTGQFSDLGPIGDIPTGYFLVLTTTGAGGLLPNSDIRIEVIGVLGIVAAIVLIAFAARKH